MQTHLVKWIIAIMTVVPVYQSVGQECGEKMPQPFPKTRITGGRNASPNSWPWQVSIQFEISPKHYQHVCGGTVVDKRWVLSVAHCFDAGFLNDSRRNKSENYRLVLGDHILSSQDGSEQLFDIDMIIEHSKWVPNVQLGFPNDIALLRLAGDAKFNDTAVGAACLPEQQNMNFTALKCWITGWGKVNWDAPQGTDILQEAMIEVISNEVCAEHNYGFIRDTHICAGMGTPNICEGDSGSPLSCEKDGRWYVAGVASWTIIFCEGVPPVYTRVSKYWEWIQYIMDTHQPERATLFTQATPTIDTEINNKK